MHPTPSSCAASSLGDVLRLWQGLGYPRRARNLHAAAAQIAAAGEFPATVDALLQLPGVGSYTARAFLTNAAGPADVEATAAFEVIYELVPIVYSPP